MDELSYYLKAPQSMTRLLKKRELATEVSRIRKACLDFSLSRNNSFIAQVPQEDEKFLNKKIQLDINMIKTMINKRNTDLVEEQCLIDVECIKNLQCSQRVNNQNQYHEINKENINPTQLIQNDQQNAIRCKQTAILKNYQQNLNLIKRRCSTTHSYTQKSKEIQTNQLNDSIFQIFTKDIQQSQPNLKSTNLSPYIKQKLVQLTPTKTEQNTKQIISSDETNGIKGLFSKILQLLENDHDFQELIKNSEKKAYLDQEPQIQNVSYQNKQPLKSKIIREPLKEISYQSIDEASMLNCLQTFMKNNLLPYIATNQQIIVAPASPNRNPTSIQPSNNLQDDFNCLQVDNQTKSKFLAVAQMMIIRDRKKFLQSSMQHSMDIWKAKYKQSVHIEQRIRTGIYLMKRFSAGINSDSKYEAFNILRAVQRRQHTQRPTQATYRHDSTFESVDNSIIYDTNKKQQISPAKSQILIRDTNQHFYSQRINQSAVQILTSNFIISRSAKIPKFIKRNDSISNGPSQVWSSKAKDFVKKVSQHQRFQSQDVFEPQCLSSQFYSFDQ